VRRKLHLFLEKSTTTAATRAALFDSNMHQIVYHTETMSKKWKKEKKTKK